MLLWRKFSWNYSLIVTQLIKGIKIAEEQEILLSLSQLEGHEVAPEGRGFYSR